MKNTENVLVRPTTNEHAWKEPVHEDFVSREDFINRTGIFVSPSHFDYIYEMEFKESDLSVDAFIETYESEHGGEVCETELKGTFKYLVMDDSLNCLGEYGDKDEPNIYDIINSLSRECEHEHLDKSDRITKMLTVCQDMQNINQRLSSMLYEIQMESDASNGVPS